MAEQVSQPVREDSAHATSSLIGEDISAPQIENGPWALSKYKGIAFPFT